MRITPKECNVSALEEVFKRLQTWEVRVGPSLSSPGEGRAQEGCAGAELVCISGNFLFSPTIFGNLQSTRAQKQKENFAYEAFHAQSDWMLEQGCRDEQTSWSNPCMGRTHRPSATSLQEQGIKQFVSTGRAELPPCLLKWKQSLGGPLKKAVPADQQPEATLFFPSHSVKMPFGHHIV